VEENEPAVRGPVGEGGQLLVAAGNPIRG
jgi:hypothetical protein